MTDISRPKDIKRHRFAAQEVSFCLGDALIGSPVQPRIRCLPGTFHHTSAQAFRLSAFLGPITELTSHLTSLMNDQKACKL